MPSPGYYNPRPQRFNNRNQDYHHPADNSSRPYNQTWYAPRYPNQEQGYYNHYTDTDHYQNQHSYNVSAPEFQPRIRQNRPFQYNRQNEHYNNDSYDRGYRPRYEQADNTYHRARPRESNYNSTNRDQRQTTFRNGKINHSDTFGKRVETKSKMKESYKPAKESRTMKHEPNSKVKISVDSDNINMREKLTDQFTSGVYECMVCCEKVRQKDPIWNCGTCYTGFHLRCIRKWAKSSMSGKLCNSYNSILF